MYSGTVFMLYKAFLKWREEKEGGGSWGRGGGEDNLTPPTTFKHPSINAPVNTFTANSNSCYTLGLSRMGLEHSLMSVLIAARPY